jgi:hypothetical protein
MGGLGGRHRPDRVARSLGFLHLGVEGAVLDCCTDVEHADVDAFLGYLGVQGLRVVALGGLGGTGAASVVQYCAIVRKLGVGRVLDIFGSAQSVTFIWVDHERYLVTERRDELPDLAKWRDRVLVTVKGENGAVRCDTRPEQGPVSPRADWAHEKVGMMRLELRCGATPCGRIHDRGTYGGRLELRGVRRCL